MEQPCIEDAKSNICYTNNKVDDIEDKTIWFWKESVNKTESNLESGRKSDD